MKTTVVIAAAFLLCATVALGYDDIDDKAAHEIYFAFYSRENPHDPEIAVVADLPLSQPLSNFDASRKTMIIVHGWHGNIRHAQNVKEAYLKKFDANIIIVEWHRIDTIMYPVAAVRVKVVGRQIAAMVEYLVTYGGLDTANLHIVGHSLGAHISGMTANNLPSNITIGRITGLDPAGPLFMGGPESRLDKSHASFVDIIHTCANVFGFHEAIGHIDFYPNGGQCSQPGCTIKDLITGKCSHNRAYDLFLESITHDSTMLAHLAPVLSDDGFPDCRFHSQEEVDRQPMGLTTPVSARGVYCLATRDRSPFGYGARRASVMTNRPSNAAIAIIKANFLRKFSIGNSFE